ncbi:lipid II flippase MurJ [Actinoplanes sp. NPDC089786]|uniref:murein biosynthesis integral membrane protein MurJ n=1 Tax=Actinoplanes sp. NPDC089786 TaxID=3155185 RepID=UPI0034356C1D
MTPVRPDDDLPILAAEPALAHESPAAAVGDSMTVAVWTAISRITGVVRGVVIAAVLGATLFANTYQFTNSLPNLVFYGLLGGSMLSSLVIPALVRHVDTGDRRAAERVAGGYLGIIALGSAVLTPLAVLAAPLALAAATPGAGGPARDGILLVLMLLPQIPLYGLVATAGAAMNAHGRFALAAAAPALENIGTIVVLGLVAAIHPGLGGRPDAPVSALVLLGLGTTGAVGAHAALQWYGARRAGVRLRPRAGWRDAEVRRVLRRALPSLAQAALAAAQLLILLILANRVAGGVVAFQLALNFYFLPIALGATPVALALAPRLSRMRAARDAPAFRDTFVRGLVFALFLAVPAAAGYLAIAGPIAQAVAFGGFDTDAGTTLITTALGTLALGIGGETAFLVATYACLAREDTRTPMRAMLLQLGVCLAGASLAPAVDGPAVLAVLGLSMSAGALISAGYLVVALLRGLGGGTESLGRPVLRILGVAVLMALPAHLVAGFVADRAGAVAGVAAAALIGVAIYFGAQKALRAPEMAWVTDAARNKVGMTAGGGKPRRRRARRLGRGPGATANLVLLAGAAGAGALLGLNPLAAVMALGAIGVGAWVFARPAVAAYLLIFLTPLTAGIDRGTVLPVLRPNEALAVLVGAALVVRWVVRVRTGGVRIPRMNSLDGAFIGLAVFSSIVPLLMMLARHREITADDLQHAIVLWKYLAVYFIIRFSISSVKQAYRCIALSMATACIVSVLGVLQSLDLFGVPKLLGTLWAPFGVERTLAIGRGSSTLALAAAVADLAVLNLALAVGLLLRGARHRVLLGGVILICLFGTLGAGEFSTVLGLFVAVAMIVVVSRATRLIGYAVPLLLLGGVVMWPVIQTRLLGFQSASGLPDSWIVRLRNLNTYFWPELGSHGNWLLGVRPSARVPAAHEEFGWVWIESGYTWLLWGGGVPLLGAYLCWVVVSLRRATAAARHATGAVAAIGLAVSAAVAADVVLMLFDPHLTYRGAADALFGLLAILRSLTEPPGPDDKPPGAGHQPRDTEAAPPATEQVAT